jgi:hypothetical protein
MVTQKNIFLSTISSLGYIDDPKRFYNSQKR